MSIADRARLVYHLRGPIGRCYDGHDARPCGFHDSLHTLTPCSAPRSRLAETTSTTASNSLQEPGE
jgi:hypothetical protein